MPETYISPILHKLENDTTRAIKTIPGDIMKKHLLSFILMFTLVLGLFSGCGQTGLGNGKLFIHKEESANDTYDSLMDAWFTSRMEKDPLSCHYTLAEPSKYGISFDDISFSALSRKQSKIEKKEYAQFLDELHNISYRNLNDRQKMVYNILTEYYHDQTELADYYYYQNLLSPTEGIPGNLPVLLSSYTFSCVEDIETYLQLLDNVDIYFNQVAVFGDEQAKEHLLPAPSTLSSAAEFCRSFSDFTPEHLLLTSFKERIDQCDFLSETQQQKYETRNTTLVRDVVLPSYKKMAEKLAKLANTSENTGSLCHLPKGQNYYSLLVKAYSGCDISPFLLFQEIDSRRSQDLEEMSALFMQDPSLVRRITEYSCPLSEPEEMIEVLRNAVANDYPAFPDTNLSIFQISPQMRKYCAPAYYFISPIDRIQWQQIYYNPESFSTTLSLFTTMAHEGFPGHLYQTILSYSYGYEPVRSLISFPGYVEGWATYVEMESYQYAGLPANLATVLSLNQSVVLSLYASTDIGIHYYGWGTKEVKDFLKTYGIEQDNVIEEIYQLILNSPGNYLKYAVGHMEFRQLREEMEENYPDSFTLMDFHKCILQTGPAPFSIVEKELLDYFESEEQKTAA